MKYFGLMITLLLSANLFGQYRTIKGTVVDEKGVGVPAATIIILAEPDSTKNILQCTKEGTVSNIDGDFELEINTQTHYIEINALGMEDKIVKIEDSTYWKIQLRISKDPVPQVKTYGRKLDLKMLVGKPAIYLYPTQKAQINITHDFKGDIGTTYPAYNTGWHVIADPNGSLFNMDDHRNYEYLFWDGIYAFPIEHYQFKDGFVVPKEKLQHFLLEKLSLVGMNNKEINDFIVYWLPVLNKNDYNFIHFRINDDIDHSSVLHVNPEPDSRIRLFMEFKEVEKGYTIPTQQLQAYPRKGFTLVEWGGGKIEQVIQVM